MQNGAFHAWHEFDNPSLADVLDEPVDDCVAQFSMGHLATAEAEAGLHLVTLSEEADSLIFLGLIVVLVHSDGEFTLLDDDDFLFFLGGPVALFLSRRGSGHSPVCGRRAARRWARLQPDLNRARGRL